MDEVTIKTEPVEVEGESPPPHLVKVEVDIDPTQIQPVEDMYQVPVEVNNVKREPTESSDGERDLISEIQTPIEEQWGFARGETCSAEPEAQVHQQIEKRVINVKTTAEAAVLFEITRKDEFNLIHYQCGTCCKVFTFLSNLITHFMSHEKRVQYPTIRPPSGEYECATCCKKFAFHSELEAHTRTHTKEKPYACFVCNKQFSQKVCLTGHLRYHTGEKPYNCTECTERFYSCSGLRNHMVIHMQEKPYGCSVCNKRFVTNGNLTSHMKIHSGEKTHECSICSKKFLTKNHLSVHMRTHTDEKPFECYICKQRYRKKCTLKTHIVNYHRVK